MSSEWSRRAVACTVFWLAILVMGACSEGPEGPSANDRPFISSEWKLAANSGWTTVRADMYRDLLRTRVLKEITEEELLDLLGPPSSRLHYRGRDFLEYRLGREPGPLSVDSLWLQFEMSDALVQEVRVTTD